ncbi:MAG: oligopeptide/dipeptide ABC transporter ATP-binding protein [Brevinematia bacterium]
MDKFLEIIEVSHTFYIKNPNTFFSYIPVKALERINLHIPKSTTFSIVGESGSGKTTLGNIILGALRPTKGDVRWNGNSIFSAEVRKEYLKQIHTVSQNPLSSLNPRMNVKTIIAEPLIFRKRFSRSEIEKRIMEVIEEVKLSRDILYKYPHELSGGEKQRVSIARSIVSHPSILVLDEPVSSLDVSVRAQVLNLLMEIKKNHNLTYVYISHDMSTTRFISDYLLVLYKGRVMEFGESEKVFSYPTNPYTRFLLFSVPGQTLVPEFQVVQRDEKGQGCPFYDRCPLASGICMKSFPDPREVSKGHISYCHNA